MKKTIFLGLITFCTFFSAFAQIIKFPESFKYDAKIIPEMQLVKITQEIRESGIYKNPAVITNKEEMQAFVNNYEVNNVTKVYVELYEATDVKNKGNDAGVVVSEFNSKQSLERILPTLYPQSNYVFLTVDKYLILVWYDGRNSDQKLRKSVEYYQKKLAVKEFKAIDSRENEESFSMIEEDMITSNNNDIISETAPKGMFTTLGFGSVLTKIFSENELTNLKNYIQKFEQNYNTEIAIVNIGNQDLTEEMMEGFASDLVFNFKERIKKNIVIVFDESKNKSWVYFGTNNGKILNKLPLERLKNEFNQKLEKHQIYKGLNKLLMEFEIAMIEASGQSAKIPSNFNE